jgi:hypothetical protein
MNDAMGDATNPAAPFYPERSPPSPRSVPTRQNRIQKSETRQDTKGARADVPRRPEGFPSQQTATIGERSMTRRALPRESKIAHYRVHFDPLGDVRAAATLGSGFHSVGLQPTGWSRGAWCWASRSAPPRPRPRLRGGTLFWTEFLRSLARRGLRGAGDLGRA